MSSRSRLPRPASPLSNPLMASTSGPSRLKRARELDDEPGPPTKISALSASSTRRPVRGIARPVASMPAPPPLTRLRPLGPSAAPAQGRTGRTTRSASVPVKNATKPVATGIIGGKRAAPEPKVGLGRSAPSTSKAAAAVALPPIEDSDDPRWAQFQNQIASVTSNSQAYQATMKKIESAMEAERAKVHALQLSQDTLESELRTTQTQELKSRRDMLVASDELETLRKKHTREIMEMETDLARCKRELRELQDDAATRNADLRRERDMVSSLRTTISQQSNTHITLDAQLAASQAHSRSLQSEIDTLQAEVSKLRLDAGVKDKKVAEAEREVREAEGLRRKLHNMIQELKGNIRVFCRVRPPLSDEKDIADGLAAISFPDKRDQREIVLRSSTESATGAERNQVMPFSFDRVFEPHSTQSDVFEEISQLAQSCTDGYNVCIFAYGQTGSGKSFTMEGGSTEETCGMIPRAIQQIFSVTEDLKAKGWQYTLEGQFLEIYNETINDLLGSGEFDKKKHDIKHDKSGKTSVTDAVIVPLHSPNQVRTLLNRAQSRRSVASTLMNERSSRSHSVFTLRVAGHNPLTQETCEGSLNLVDLAGSERLSSSGAASDKDRLKETQAINKSLSALGDVIGALGAAGASGEKAHIPYRNSKLTYLLQNSLSGNSKTLMVLNLSPMAAHLGESLCSLRFATKVNNTTIGTARKQQIRPAA